MEITENKVKKADGTEVVYKNLKLSSIQPNEEVKMKINGIYKNKTTKFGIATAVRAEIEGTGEVSFFVGDKTSCGYINGKKVLLIDVFNMLVEGDKIAVKVETVTTKQGKIFKNYKVYR